MIKIRGPNRIKIERTLLHEQDGVLVVPSSRGDISVRLIKAYTHMGVVCMNDASVTVEVDSRVVYCYSVINPIRPRVFVEPPSEVPFRATL